VRAAPARTGLRALPYSLRFCCEGLEEKFLECGAPAPLSVRLIHDLRVSQSLVQAGPRWGVGLDDASPCNAGFTAPSGLLSCGANLAATRLPHPHLRCGFCFVKTRSLVGRAVLCPPDVSGCTDGGASRTCGTRPTLLSASASRPLNVAAPVRARTVGIPAREAGSARPTPARSGLRALP